MVLAKASTKDVGGGREAAPGVFFPDRPSLMAFPGGASPTSEDLGKKTRKPYTISKSRESWTDQDHDKFLEALHLFDRDWKKIEAFVGSKTVIQIRSHAQKYFLKVQKNGTNEHVPPPRPKRKAAHPYPQKAVKNATSQIPEAKNLRQTASLLEPDYSFTREAQPMQRNSMVATVPSLVQSSSPAEPDSACHLTKGDMANPEVVMPTNCCSSNDMANPEVVMPINCCSSSTESPRTWPTCEAVDQEKLVTSLQVMPNFAQVYNFIGSVFDPNASGHLQKLVEMDPIDVETVLILMRNLTFNLSSPDFEAHRRLLSAYGGDSGSKAQNIGNPLHARETANTPLLVQGE